MCLEDIFVVGGKILAMNLYRRSNDKCFVSSLVKFCSVFSLCGSALYVDAMVIRHDVEDELYREYAQSKEEFRAEGVLICDDDPVASVTLVRPGAILTSAQASELSAESGKIKIQFDDSAKEYSIVRWERHPRWQPRTSAENNPELFMFGFDFAIGFLDEEVSDIKPAVLFDRNVHGAEERMVTTIVSHGCTGNGKMGCQEVDYLKRAGTSTIEFFDHFAFQGIEDPFCECVGRLYFTEFKHTDTLFSLIKCTQEVQGNSDYVRTEATELECSFNRGDSGAPSFINVDGQEVLAGVCSFTVEYIEPDFVPGTGKYGNLCGYGAVGAVSDWIREILDSVKE